MKKKYIQEFIFQYTVEYSQNQLVYLSSLSKEFSLQ
jgi:hypothetical protein